MTSEPTARRTHQFGISDRLRAAREDAGFDMRTFEKVSGISRGTVYNYEAGKFPASGPRRPIILAWAMATGFDAAWLETGEAPAEPKPDGGGEIEPETRRTHGSLPHLVVSLAA